MKKLAILNLFVAAFLMAPAWAYSSDSSYSKLNMLHRAKDLPFKFGQFIDGLSGLVARDCGGCIRYYHTYPLTPGLSKGKKIPYIAVLELEGSDGEVPLSVSIDCPKLTNIKGVLTMQFNGGLGYISLEGAYESEAFTLLKAEEAESPAAEALFKKVEKYYGWDKKRDERYNEYRVDFGNLYDSASGIYDDKIGKRSIYEDGSKMLYSHFIRITRLVSRFRCASNMFYTDIHSRGYKDTVSRSTAYVAKIARNDGSETVIINCPEKLCFDNENLGLKDCPPFFSVNKGSLKLLFEPSHKKKILKLTRVITEDGELDPEAKVLKEDFKRFFKIFDRLVFSDYN